MRKFFLEVIPEVFYRVLFGVLLWYGILAITIGD
jgi:hypothetical protein